MIDLFMPFRAFLKFENVCTDNNVFRMHYKVTVIMLLVFTLLVTSKQFFGEPIHCMSDSEKDNDKDAVNSYCWIYGTYTLKSRFVGVEGLHMAYPGVGPNKADNDEQIKHTYYQWVCFVLLGQSVMFYTPRYLWKIWEGGRLKALAADLIWGSLMCWPLYIMMTRTRDGANVSFHTKRMLPAVQCCYRGRLALGSPVVIKDWSEFRRGELVSYLSYTNIHTHNMYALRYAFCEILNLVNVVGQIFLLDIFLGGAFRNYGAAVAAFTHTPRVPADMTDFAAVNPMDQFFPKLTKCWLRSYGPSGTLQFKDRLCVLPLNIVNEKIFVILWFWLIILAFVSFLSVFFRILVLSLRPLRALMIAGQLRYVKKSMISRIVKRFGYGDWFILYLLGKNMNPIIYKDLIVELSKELEHRTVMV